MRCDEHAIAGALGAERFGREGVRRDDAAHADDTGERLVEVVRIVLRLGLAMEGQLPLTQICHVSLKRPAD